MTNPKKTNEDSSGESKEEKPGDNPPQHKREEAERRERKTFEGKRGTEKNG